MAWSSKDDDSVGSLATLTTHALNILPCNIMLVTLQNCSANALNDFLRRWGPQRSIKTPQIWPRKLNFDHIVCTNHPTTIRLQPLYTVWSPQPSPPPTIPATRCRCRQPPQANPCITKLAMAAPRCVVGRARPGWAVAGRGRRRPGAPNEGLHGLCGGGEWMLHGEAHAHVREPTMCRQVLPKLAPVRQCVPPTHWRH